MATAQLVADGDVMPAASGSLLLVWTMFPFADSRGGLSPGDKLCRRPWSAVTALSALNRLRVRAFCPSRMRRSDAGRRRMEKAGTAD